MEKNKVVIWAYLSMKKESMTTITISIKTVPFFIN